MSSGWCRKNPPAIQETPERQVPSLGREDPQEEEMAAHSSILAWNPTDRGTWRAAVQRVTNKELDTSDHVQTHTHTQQN